MRKLLKILVIILLIFLTRIFLSFIINEIIIYNYNHNKYNKYLIKSLYILNINEPYIAYYNHGNILFKRKDYKNAITKYEKALKSNPNRNRICDSFRKERAEFIWNNSRYVFKNCIYFFGIISFFF